MVGKITISVLCICFWLRTAGQNAPIDFEVNGEGANWTWTVFENDDNPPLAIVSNPDVSGVNTSATVAQFTARDLGAPFAGVESMHGADIGTFDLSTSNAIITIKVYKTKISDVGIKFATPSGGAQPEIKVANTLVNEWETLIFDFTSYIGLGETTGLDQIIIFPDFEDRTADDVIYFDDITFADTLHTTDFNLTTVNVYPNPTHEILTVNSNEVIATLRLLNGLGQVILEMNPQNDTAIVDMSMAKTGFYFLQVSSTYGSIKTMKILKRE